MEAGFQRALRESTVQVDFLFALFSGRPLLVEYSQNLLKIICPVATEYGVVGLRTERKHVARLFLPKCCVQGCTYPRVSMSEGKHIRGVCLNQMIMSGFGLHTILPTTAFTLLYF